MGGGNAPSSLKLPLPFCICVHIYISSWYFSTTFLLSYTILMLAMQPQLGTKSANVMCEQEKNLLQFLIKYA